MSRIRSIKPDFWASEQVMALHRDARLLFIGIWNFADDEGRFKWSPATLRAQIFPGDLDVTVPMVEQWLHRLVHCGLIERYAPTHGAFPERSLNAHARVTGWHHQRVNRPQPSKLPDPKDCLVIPCACSECSMNAPGTFRDQTGLILWDPLGSTPRERETRAPAPGLQQSDEAIAQQPLSLSERPNGQSPDGEGVAGAFDADSMRELFAQMFRAARKVAANMSGQGTAELHQRVLETAQARSTDPRTLFVSVLQRWLAGELNKRELAAPYACFAAAWGGLIESVNGHVADPQSALMRKSADALRRRDMEAYAAAQSELAAMGGGHAE